MESTAVETENLWVAGIKWAEQVEFSDEEMRVNQLKNGTTHDEFLTNQQKGNRPKRHATLIPSNKNHRTLLGEFQYVGSCPI